jgi:hypothetical protein
LFVNVVVLLFRRAALGEMMGWGSEQRLLLLLLLLPLLLLQGVSWSHSCAKWVAVIWDRLLRKARHLGVFEGEEEAARAYDREVVRLQGANNTGLNFRDSEWLGLGAGVYFSGASAYVVQ